MASRASDQDSLVGSELGRYRVVEKIDAGGMGEVYRARDEHLARDVAIKVLPPGTLIDESARKRFHKEALTLSQLNHPNIATIHDFDTQQGVDFLVMEYIPGITLSEKVAAGPLPEKEVLRLGVQLAEGLAAAHDHGVVHRDLKPGNLRVTSDGRLKILDFGLAKLRLPVTASAVTESLSETQAMAGTLPYMAPEQVLGGEVDARTDIHAAGSVLYEMATGQRPFAEVERSQLIGAILRKPPVPPTMLNPRVSPELERIIGKGLEKEAENRYQSAKELAIDLRRLQTGVMSGLQPAAKHARWRSAKSVGLGLGILAAVIVVLITFNIGNWRKLVPGGTGARPIESLAVLPVKNFSGDPGQEFFADGMTDALIAGLAQIKAVKVISRTSIMHYKGTSETLPQIARELGVDGIVEASVMRSGSRVRMTAQLIEAREDRHLWARNYERDMTDVLALQSELVQAIAGEIRVQLTPQENERLKAARRVNPEAYEAYLKGRFYWNKRAGQDITKSIEYFQHAIEIDPDYALAYVGLADSYALLPDFGDARPREAIPKARAAAAKAIEIDDALAEAHAPLAYISAYYDYDWAAAEREFKRAVELNPGDATAHHWYALCLLFLGRHDEATAEIERARSLDPLSLAINTSVGTVLFYSRHYDSAIEQYRKTLEMDPTFVQARDYLGNVYLQNGMCERAIAEFQKAADLSGGQVRCMAGLGRAYAAAGKREQARKMLEQLKKRAQQSYVSRYELALIYTGLGEKEQAFAWLEQAYEERDRRLVELGVGPQVDPLRSDQRFQDLLRRMNFPQ
ncbi:MAG: protein kinase [Terriglobales bacterium]